LGERLVLSQNDVAAVLAFDSKAGLEERCNTLLARKLGAVWSYRKKQSVETIRGHGETVFFECEHVSFYRFTDIADRAFLCLSLAHAAGQTWTLGDPKAALTWVKDHLPHRLTL
jgi:hypothetical protein